MALNSSGLGIGFSFIGRDFVSPVIGGIRRQFGLMSNDSKKVAKTIGKGFVALTAGVITTAVAMKALGGAINLANQAGQFEQQLAAVGAITRATASELRTLEKAAIDAGIATQFSPQEAVEGLRSLGTMGFNAAEATKALVPALDLAAGGQISVAQAAQTTASALRVFGLEAEDAALTTDKLLRISNATALQAADLQLALGTVGRGAAIAKQSIDEMLPSIGLVKNTGVDASVAASSVSSALIFMAKNAKKFKKLGVDVTDAQGKFRPFLDIVQETSTALGNKFVKDSDKAAKAQKLFGRFGLSAYTAITTQLNHGIKDSTGQLVKNADAVAHLRKEMENAAGAAAEFREKLLNTFEGQKTLLRGTLETMAVVFGKPFAAVFKPFVGALTNSLNAIVRFFASLPKPVQNAIAGMTIAVIALTAALGLMLTVGGAITILLPFMSTFIMVMKAMVIAIGGVVLVVGLFAAAIALAVWAIRNNIGGIGDAFFKAVEKIKLFWRGLVELITKGGFSEEVSKEMSKAENQGIRSFAIKFYKIFYRIKRFFEGIARGFGDTLKTLEPIFGALKDVFTELADAVKDLGGDMLWFSGSPSDNFNSAGEGIGVVFGGLITGIVAVVTGIAQLIVWLMKAGYWFGDTLGKLELLRQEKLQLFIDSLKEMWQWLKKIAEKLRNSTLGKIAAVVIGGQEWEAQEDLGNAAQQAAASPIKRAVPFEAGSILYPTNEMSKPQSVQATPIRRLAPAGIPPLPPAAGTDSQGTRNAMAAGYPEAAMQEMTRLLNEVTKRPTIVSLNIDGARVGEAVASAQRGKLARQGVPVGEEAG